MSPSPPDGSSFTDGTLWALVERRAGETPDALMAGDESGRRPRLREDRRAARRAAAGPAPPRLPPPPRVRAWEDAPQRAWLFSPSAPTADPKGARHTDATIAAAAVAMNLALDLAADDRSALVFPFTHIGGITWLFSSLMRGCAHICLERFDPAEAVAVLSPEEVTPARSGTPLHLAYLQAPRRPPRT